MVHVGSRGLMFFYVFLQRTAPSVMTTELMRDFNITALALSNLSAVYFWSYVIVQVPVGLAVDRWGPKRVLSWAVALGAAGGLIFATADTLGSAGVGRFLVGAGGGVVFVCTLKIVTDWFPPHRLAMLIRTALHGLVVELSYDRTPFQLSRVDQAYQDFRNFFGAVILQGPLDQRTIT